MDLGRKLASLAIHAASAGSDQPIALYKTTMVLGLIPFSELDCKIVVSEQDGCWGVMLSDNKTRDRRTPFLCANFRRHEGDRDSAWKRLRQGGWFPVEDAIESVEIFERIENAVHRAYSAHCQSHLQNDSVAQ
jgi:hypothetical protein